MTGGTRAHQKLDRDFSRGLGYLLLFLVAAIVIGLSVNEWVL